MLGMDENGNFIEVKEQSPYDMSRVNGQIPKADWVPEEKAISKEMFYAQNFNESSELTCEQKALICRRLKNRDLIRNSDVMDDYRSKIACEQDGEVVNIANILLNKAIEQSVHGPDFKQSEVSNLIVREDWRMPSRDWETYVPGDRIGWDGSVPGNLPGRDDVSNTSSWGQMSGVHGTPYDYTLRNPKGRYPMSRPNRRPPMGDFWSDLATSVQTGITDVIPDYIEQQVIGTPGTTTSPTGQVIYRPATTPTTTIYGTTASVSKIDPKILMIGGAAIVGVLVLAMVLRR